MKSKNAKTAGRGTSVPKATHQTVLVVSGLNGKRRFVKEAL